MYGFLQDNGSLREVIIVIDLYVIGNFGLVIGGK